jgi:hypothetical protein
MSIMEALLSKPDANNMLRDGIRLLAFESYMGMPVTYPGLVDVQTSSKPEEYYLRDGTIGRIPRVRSGAPVPMLTRRFEGSAVVQNNMYASIAEILGDDIRFDKLGVIRQTATKMGVAGRVTEEAEFYSVVADTANYVRNSTTNDNDIGANTSAVDLTYANFELALATIATAKDRTSGVYMGLRADTIIAGPLMEYPIMKMLTSANVVAAGTAGAVTQVGDMNVYRGAIRKIIISPHFTATYDWIVADTRMPGIVYQQVEPFNVYQTTQTPDNHSWLTRDVIEYKVMGYFGVGFVDDRGWVYRTSSTRPVV